jgi:hypothetical protein
MDELLTCACCGQKKELCGSCRSNDIQQPRLCKDCLAGAMDDNFESLKINDIAWLKQLAETDDRKSWDGLTENVSKEEREKLDTLYVIWGGKNAKKTEAEKKVVPHVQSPQDARGKSVEAKRAGRTKKVRKGK